MPLKIIGRSGSHYLLVDENLPEDGSGGLMAPARVLDADDGVLYEPNYLGSITKFNPYYEEHPHDDDLLAKLLSTVNDVRGPPPNTVGLVPHDHRHDEADDGDGEQQAEENEPTTIDLNDDAKAGRTSFGAAERKTSDDGHVRRIEIYRQDHQRALVEIDYDEDGDAINARTINTTTEVDDGWLEEAHRWMWENYIDGEDIY